MNDSARGGSGGEPLDRLGSFRGNREWVAAQFEKNTARFVLLWRDLNLFDGSDPGRPVFLTRDEADAADIMLDGSELEDARWFTRAELEDGLKEGRLRLPLRVSISYRLIEAWFDQGEPGRLSTLQNAQAVGRRTGPVGWTCASGLSLASRTLWARGSPTYLTRSFPLACLKISTRWDPP